MNTLDQAGDMLTEETLSKSTESPAPPRAQYASPYPRANGEGALHRGDQIRRLAWYLLNETEENPPLLSADDFSTELRPYVEELLAGKSKADVQTSMRSELQMEILSVIMMIRSVILRQAELIQHQQI